MKNKSAAECIGFRYSWDIADVRYVRYQARKQSVPVYTMFDGYVCCPPAGTKPPAGWNWNPDGDAYGRTVYFAKSE